MRLVIDSTWTIGGGVDVDVDREEWILYKDGKEFASRHNLPSLVMKLKNLMYQASTATDKAGATTDFGDCDTVLAATIPASILTAAALLGKG